MEYRLLMVIEMDYGKSIFFVEDSIKSTTKKPIYSSYKDICMNRIITHRRNNTIHTGNDNATATHAGTPPTTS